MCAKGEIIETIDTGNLVRLSRQLLDMTLLAVESRMEISCLLLLSHIKSKPRRDVAFDTSVISHLRLMLLIMIELNMRQNED